jgi:hypothetical protein
MQSTNYTWIDFAAFDFLRFVAAPLRLVPIAFHTLPTSLVVSFLGMTLSSLNPTVYGWRFENCSLRSLYVFAAAELKALGGMTDPNRS